MPSVSKKQHNLMALVANNPKAAKRLGIPKSVGEDYMKADKGKKFAKGGTSKLGKLFKGKESYAEEVKEAKAIKAGKITPSEYAKGEKMEEAKKMKKGGKVKKYAEGGSIASGKKPAESDYDKKLREEALQEMRDKKMRDQMGKAYDKSREQSLGAPEKKMRSGGSCGMKKYARGGGIEVRGKTRGKII